VQPLDLNLSSRPFRNNTLLWAAFSVAAVALIAFSWWNVDAWLGARANLVDLRAKVDNYDRRMSELAQRSEKARRDAARFDLARLQDQADKANDVIQWKAFSWTRLFNMLEEVQPYRLRMLSVRPTFYATERRSARDSLPEGAVPVDVEGIAENLETLLEFERELIADVHFASVEPDAQGLLDGNNREIKFDMKFLYFPDAVEDEQDHVPFEPLGPRPSTPRDNARLLREWEAEQQGQSPGQEAGDDAAAPDTDGASAADATAGEAG